MIEHPWFKSYDPGMPHTLQPYPERTLLEAVRETVTLRPEHTALIFKGRRMSYAELERLSNAFGSALVDLGVKKGDRVALLIPNSPQAIIAQLGAWKAGAIVCPINSLYTASELEFALKEVSAETVVVLTPFYEKVKALQERSRGQACHRHQYQRPYDAALAPAVHLAEREERRPLDPAPARRLQHD